MQEKEITNENEHKKLAFPETGKSRKQYLPEIPKSVTPSPLSNIKIFQDGNTYDVVTTEDDHETNADDNQAFKGQISITQSHANQGGSVVNDQT